MSERQKKMNQKFWDGLHPFPPRCYTCLYLEKSACVGCKGNHSGENDNYTPIEWKE
jgi:hypothetical protein